MLCTAVVPSYDNVKLENACMQLKKMYAEVWGVYLCEEIILAEEQTEKGLSFDL